MAQLISCSECRKQLQVPDELLGKTVQCPECGHMFIGAATATEPLSASRPEPEPRHARDEKQEERSRYDDDDYDEVPNLRRSAGGRRRGQKPSKVTNLGVLSLIGGIYAILWAVGFGGGSGGLCCLWPGTYYSIVVGILAIVKGAALLGDSAYDTASPTGIGIMLIINIVNVDVVNLVLGVIILVSCNDDEVREYFAT